MNVGPSPGSLYEPVVLPNNTNERVHGPEPIFWPEWPDWHADAACAGQDPAMFYPEGPEPVRRALRAHAQTFCYRCPVRDTCSAAGDTEDAGVWGGIERDPLCGSVTGYNRHYRRHELPCTRCLRSIPTSRARRT